MMPRTLLAIATLLILAFTLNTSTSSAHHGEYPKAIDKDCVKEECTYSDEQLPKFNYDSGDYRIVNLSDGRLIIMDKETEHKFYVVIKGYSVEKDSPIIRFQDKRTGKFAFTSTDKFRKIGPFLLDVKTGERIVGVKGKYYADKRAAVVVIFDAKLKAIYSYIWLRDYRVSIELDKEVTDNINDNLDIDPSIQAQIDARIEEAVEAEKEAAIDEAVEQYQEVLESHVEIFTNDLTEETFDTYIEQTNELEVLINNLLAPIGGSVSLDLAIDNAMNELGGGDNSNNHYEITGPSGTTWTKQELKYLNPDDLLPEDLEFFTKLGEIIEEEDIRLFE